MTQLCNVSVRKFGVRMHGKITRPRLKFLARVLRTIMEADGPVRNRDLLPPGSHDAGRISSYLGREVTQKLIRRLGDEASPRFALTDLGRDVLLRSDLLSSDERGALETPETAWLIGARCQYPGCEALADDRYRGLWACREHLCGSLDAELADLRAEHRERWGNVPSALSGGEYEIIGY